MRENMNDRVKKGFCLLLTIAVVASMTVVVPLSTAQPSDDSSSPVKGVVKSLKLSKKKVSLESGKKKTVKVKVKTKGPASKKIKVKRTKAAKKVLKKVKVKKPNKKGVSKIKLRAKEVTKQKTVKLKVKTKARNAKGKHIKKKLKVTVKPDASAGGAGGGNGAGGAGGKTPVLNPSNPEDLPTNSYAIAAPGEYAEIVCALGGADALAASSSDFIDAASDVSSSWNSVSKLDAVFTNAGTGKLKDGGLATLKSLHEKGKCDAVLLESTEVISSSDLTSLRNAGIMVMAPVSLSSISNIESTVKAIGKLLTDKTGGYSMNMANDYTSLCSAVINKCENDCGSYTLYVTDWDANATYQAKANGETITSGTGLAATSKSTTTSGFLASGGVTNTPTLSGFSSLSSTGLYWLNQFQVNTGTVTLTEGDVSASQCSKNSVPYREFVLAYQDGDSSKPVGLGESNFPALIAADIYVAKGLMSSRDSEEAAYTPYGRFDANKARNILGVKKDDDHYIQTLIGDGTSTGSDCYKVYTAPHGTYSSWTDGSIESILFTAWTNCKFYGTYSESELKDLVTDFYKDFYGNGNLDYSSIMANAGE